MERNGCVYAYDEFCVVLSIVEHLTELHPDAVLDGWNLNFKSLSMTEMISD